jgi:hypothetical protein
MIRRTLCAVIMLCVMYGASATAQPDAAAGNDAGRIEYIQHALDEGDVGATVWWWSWLGIYSASAGYSFYSAAATESDGTRIIQAVYGVQSALGAAGMLLSRTASLYGAGDLRAMPSATSGERAARLSRGEELLRSAAEGEAFGRSWLSHALALAVNGGGALVLWKGYDDRLERDGRDPGREALLCFVVGTVVSELQIFTQPTRAIDDWATYRSRYNRGAGIDDAAARPRFFFSAMPGAYVVSAAIRF